MPSRPYVAMLRAFTRRGFLARMGAASAIAVAATLGHFGLPVPVAFAAACNTCYGPCHPCFTAATCDSPNGVYECFNGCHCPAWELQGECCTIGCMFVEVQCCDDGTMNTVCVPCAPCLC